MKSQISPLIELIAQHQPVAVLTGAGISTDSGIPAYRDSSGTWTGPTPVKAADFRNHHQVRQRYWIRSMFGWPGVNTALPNEGHLALATLEQKGIVSHVITQNVDGLHQRAGSEQVTELHGSLAEVICLNCGETTSRGSLQDALKTKNPEYANLRFESGPDGDANIINNNNAETGFSIINCENCAGILKPDVVFFGENVPKDRVAFCMDAVNNSAMLLCVGTSLAVMSGYRFCRSAEQNGKPIALINQGLTRADDLAKVKVTNDCTTTLKDLCTYFC